MASLSVSFNSLHEHSEACHHALLHPFFLNAGLVLEPIDAYVPLYWQLIFCCSQFDKAFANLSQTVEHEGVRKLLKDALASNYSDFDAVRHQSMEPDVFRIFWKQLIP
jgi:hypothetical protein